MLPEGRQPALEDRCDRLDMGQQVLLLDDLDILKRHRATDRVAGIGVAVDKSGLVIGASHAFDHTVVDQAGAERQVTRGQPLGAGDEIRVQPEHIARREPMAEPPEAGHDFVRNVEDVVGPADLLRAQVIALGGDDHTARGQHGLGDEGGDPVGADLGNGVLEIGDLGVAECLDGHAFWAAMRRDIRQEMHQIVSGIKMKLGRIAARHGRRQVGRAVIGLLA